MVGRMGSQEPNTRLSRFDRLMAIISPWPHPLMRGHNPDFRDMFVADPASCLRTHSRDALPEMIRWKPLRSCIRPIKR